MNPTRSLVARFALTAFEAAYVQPSHSLLSDMVRARKASLLDALRDVPRDAAILEVGCAFGGLLRAVLDAGYTNISGCDVDIKSLEKARAYVPEAGLALCTAENLAYGDESHDVVICAGVLNYLQNPEKSLAESQRVLRRDGILILSVGNALSSGRAIVSWGRLIRMQPLRQRGYRYYTRRRAISMLRRAGFVPKQTSYFFHPLPFEYRWQSNSQIGRRIARLRNIFLHVLGSRWGNEFLITARIR